MTWIKTLHAAFGASGLVVPPQAAQ